MHFAQTYTTRKVVLLLTFAAPVLMAPIPLCATPLAPTPLKPIEPRAISLNVNNLWSDAAHVGEPVLVRLTLTNMTNKRQTSIFSHRVYFVVYDSSNRRISGLPPKISDSEFVPAGSTTAPEIIPELMPKGDRTEVYDLRQWFSFQKPGRYTVYAQLLNTWVDTWPYKPVLKSKFQVTVLPFDKTHLEARCLELFAHIEPSFRHLAHNTLGLNSYKALQALCSMRNEVALPYFDYLAKEYSSAEACLAIRRVKTKRATQLIKTLAARRDNVGKAARQALKVPLEETKLRTGIQN